MEVTKPTPEVIKKGNQLMAETIDLPVDGELKFHTSWDAIIPVVLTIIPPHGWELAGVPYQEKVLVQLQRANLDQLWIAVYEFLLWKKSKTHG